MPSPEAGDEYDESGYDYGENYQSHEYDRKHLPECLQKFQELGFGSFKACVRY